MKTTKFYFSPLRSVKIRTPDHTPRQKGRQRRRTSCLADKNLHGDGRQQDPHMLTPSTRQVHPQGFFFSKLCNYDSSVCKIPKWSHPQGSSQRNQRSLQDGWLCSCRTRTQTALPVPRGKCWGERGRGGADGYRISLLREQLAVTKHGLGGGGSAAAGECGRWAPCRLQQFRQVPGKPQARRGLLPTGNTAVRRESASPLLGVSRLHAKPPAGNWP